MTAGPVTFRRAIVADLPAVVALLADDALGRGREDPCLPLAEGYRHAFAAIDADANQLLAVAAEGEVVLGTLQISFIPGLSRRGAWRGELDSVRVAAARRGERLGERMVLWAVEQCRARGCALVQLTTDKRRTDAHRFYDRLGFAKSHEGYKLAL